MAFTKINAAGIGTTETVTVDGLTVINDGSFGGNLSVGGTITYEDVTNVDSVGLITARNGIVVGSGITLSKDGDIFFTGIITGNGSGLTNLATDLVNDTSPQLGGNLDVNTKNIVFGDSGSASDDRLTFGAGTDLSIYHDGTHSYVVNTVGNLRIQNNGTIKNAQFEVDTVDFNDSANSEVRVRINSDGLSLVQDNDKVQIGASQDLTLYHDGSNSYIDETGTGGLLIRSGDIYLRNPSNADMIHAQSGGYVKLYYDGSEKLATTSGGVSVTGSATVSGDLSIAASLVHTGDTDTKITFGNNIIKFDTDTNERIRIDNNGKVLIGATSGINGFTDVFQIFKSDSTAAITLKRASNNAYAPYINFIKSRGSTAADATVLQSGDIMAYIRFSGTDGTDTTESAIIQAVVDGTPGNNDMPGRLVFSTTADGSNASTERMRIDSGGRVLIGSTDGASYADSSLDDLIIGSTASGKNDGITILSGTGQNGTLAFADSGGSAQGLVGYVHNGDYLRLHAGNTLKLRIDTDGLKFNSDTAAANALDDYEEGTFTISFPGGVVITNNEMAYTKIGRQVTCTGRITFATSGSNSIVNLQGLPFTPNANLGNSAQGGVIPEHTKSSNDNPPFFMAVEASANTIRIRNRNSGALTISQCSGQSFRFILTYFAS